MYSGEETEVLALAIWGWMYQPLHPLYMPLVAATSQELQ